MSVVIPAFNASRTVEQTVRSALDQTMSDLEVIVVDDGSTDDTAAVVQAMGDLRVTVIRQANAGVAAARNAGILASRGRWVAFLDADDLWVAHKLERQLAAARDRPGTDAVQAGALFVDDDLRVIAVRGCTEEPDVLLSFLRFQNLPAAASSWLVERALLTRIGMFDPTLVILEDWDVSLKIARYGHPALLAEPLTMYRMHPANRSRDLSIHVEPGFRVLERLFDDPELAPHIRQRKAEIYARFYTMLCGGAFRVHQWRACARWGAKALRTDPRTGAYMLALPIRRLTRRTSGRSNPVPAPADHPAAPVP